MKPNPFFPAALFLFSATALFAQRTRGVPADTSNTIETFREECEKKYAAQLDCECAVFHYPQMVQAIKQERLDVYLKFREGEIAKVEAWCKEGLKVSGFQPHDVNSAGVSRSKPCQTHIPEYAPEGAVDACDLVNTLKNRPVPALDEIKAPRNSTVWLELGNRRLCRK